MELDVSNDPGSWPHVFTEEIRTLWIQKGPSFFQNKDSDFSKSTRQYEEANGKTKMRSLTKSVFVRTLKNGENVTRTWLLYSPSKNALFCFTCRLFSTAVNKFSSPDGQNDWKHIQEYVLSHENSADHKQSTLTYTRRGHIASRIDRALVNQYNCEVQYWKDILKRIVAVVKFLTSRGLAFRGENQTAGSPNNGNYLGCLELLSQFDPFIFEHLQRYGNPGKGHTSYLSANICNEFIDIMGKRVLNEILAELRNAKYYSISVDSTPDLSHVDQMTFVIRYVHEGNITERFLEFIPIQKHGANYLANAVIAFLEKHGIDLNNCRGQSYDNAANMAGQYSGLQARIKEKCEFAVFVPCAAHSLNLVGVHAAQCVMEATDYFQFIQKIYTFFSSSNHRWNTMKQFLEDKLVIKCLSETRWSARASAVTALHSGYINFFEALLSISEDRDQSNETRREALSISKKMQKLETVILTEVWSDVLSKINKTNISIQNKTLTMDVAINLLKSLVSFLNNARNEFDKYESAAKLKFPEADYKDITHRQVKRSSRLTFFDGSSEAVHSSGKDRFKVEVFIPIIDTLVSQLQQRSAAYVEVHNRFSFLSNLRSISSNELQSSCRSFAEFYHLDVNGEELETECNLLKQYLETDVFKKTEQVDVLLLYTTLRNDQLEETFPNVAIALRIFLSLMITNCTGERSFSKLKRIKNGLRSTMLQERLNSLSLMSIENDILLSLDFEDIIEDFANRKSRRKALSAPSHTN